MCCVMDFQFAQSLQEAQSLYINSVGADKAVFLTKLVVFTLTEQRLELIIISVIFSMCCTGLHTFLCTTAER
jgi:hypothetical protein